MTGAMLPHRRAVGRRDRRCANTLACVKLHKTIDEWPVYSPGPSSHRRPWPTVQEALFQACAAASWLPCSSAASAKRVSTPNMIDVIFQPMARRMADGPRTTTGHLAFPHLVGDPSLRRGDLIWVDAGSDYHGYASDFGRTWVVGRPPTPPSSAASSAWLASWTPPYAAIVPRRHRSPRCARRPHPRPTGRPCMRPTATPRGCRTSTCHGVGVESAEMPFWARQRPRLRRRSHLEPGMVMVLEPAIWETAPAAPGRGDRGCHRQRLDSPGWRPPYDPFEVPA